MPLDQEFAERFGLFQHPGGHRSQERLARDEFHLQREHADEKISIDPRVRHAKAGEAVFQKT